MDVRSSFHQTADGVCISRLWRESIDMGKHKVSNLERSIGFKQSAQVLAKEGAPLLLAVSRSMLAPVTEPWMFGVAFTKPLMVSASAGYGEKALIRASTKLAISERAAVSNICTCTCQRESPTVAFSPQIDGNTGDRAMDVCISLTDSPFQCVTSTTAGHQTTGVCIGQL